MAAEAIRSFVKLCVLNREEMQEWDIIYWPVKYFIYEVLMINIMLCKPINRSTEDKGGNCSVIIL